MMSSISWFEFTFECCVENSIFKRKTASFKKANSKLTYDKEAFCFMARKHNENVINLQSEAIRKSRIMQTTNRLSH